MTPLLFLILTLAGGVGACCRYGIDSWVTHRNSTLLPLGTITVNLLGSFALGIVTGLVTANFLPTEWLWIIGSGFLGGFTTFSAASIETIRLLEDGKKLLSALNGLGVLVIATAAVALGYWLGSSI